MKVNSTCSEEVLKKLREDSGAEVITESQVEERKPVKKEKVEKLKHKFGEAEQKQWQN